MFKVLVSIACLALTLSACSKSTDDPKPTDTQTGAAGDNQPAEGPYAGTDKELVTTASVVDASAADGPGAMLCYTTTADDPPQCGGLPITNWSWDNVPGKTTSAGVTWVKDVVLTGKLKDDTWTVTQPTVAIADYQGKLPVKMDERTAYYEPACKKPADGWAVPDASKAGLDDIRATITPSVRKAVDATPDPNATYKGVVIPGYGDTWTNYYNKQSGDVLTGDAHKNPGDALPLLTITVQGDKAAAEKAIRKTWGGALCIGEAQFLRKDLQDIVNELFGMSKVPGPGALVSGGVYGGIVELDVEYDDGTLQKFVDDKYGNGSVKVYSVMQPTGK